MADDEALRWAIRLDGESLSEAEQTALDAWLEADDRRAGALLRAEATLSYLDRGRALAAPGADFEIEPERPRFGRRAFLVAGGLGAACAVGLAGLFLIPTGTQDIATVVGEVRRVPLPDGSFASLNTASRVAISMHRGPERLVSLEQGEAWFQVAHDQSRPFIVAAGDIRVQAVGTAFSVRRRGATAEILVTQGVVETWVVGREALRTRIAAGARGLVSAEAPRAEVAQAPEAVDRALAWRVGDIALNGETLSHAVAEINRYNQRQLVVTDPALASEPLVGYFRTNEPENFGRAVANMIGARVVEDGDTIRLERRGT